MKLQGVDLSRAPIGVFPWECKVMLQFNPDFVSDDEAKEMAGKIAKLFEGEK